MKIRAGAFMSFIAVVFIHLQVAAQQPAVSASVDRSRIILGDQFTLTIQVEASVDDGPVVFPVIPDSLNHLEVIERKARDSVRAGNRIMYTQEIVMTSFDSGLWVIPAQTFSVAKKNFESQGVPVSVTSVPLRGDEYNDIKDIIPVKDSGIDWKKWLLVFVSVLVISLAGSYWWKHRKHAPAVVPQVSRSTAFEEAMGALRKIQQEKANEKGYIKEYYSSIYDVFRLYLARVSGKPFMQYTTDEILMDAKDMLMPAGFSSTAEVMRITDAVKFARYQSDFKESTDALERIKMGIEEINSQKRSF